MHFTIENGEKLNKKIFVEIPHESIQKDIRQELERVAKKSNISGFRPGKVPTKIIEERYGNDIRVDVLKEAIQKSLDHIVKESNLRIVDYPHIEITQNETDQNLKYMASFEVYPEIELADLSSLNLKQYAVDILEEDIDKVIEDVKKQHSIWNESQKLVKADSKVVIDFSGTIDGNSFSGSTQKDFPFILGYNIMPQGLEEGIVGMGIDEEKTLDVDFPHDHNLDGAAGKKVKMNILLKKIFYPQLPELNEEFVKKLGVSSGDIMQFRDQVKLSIQNNVNKFNESILAKNIYQQLLEKHSFPLPDILIQQEKETILQQLKKDHEKRKINVSLDDKKLLDEVDAQAKKDVMLRLICTEYARELKIKLNNQKVQQLVNNFLGPYQDHDKMHDMVYKNPDLMSYLESKALEEQFISSVKEKAIINCTNVNYHDLMHMKDN